MRLQKVLNILGQMPKKSQKVVMAVVDFDKMTPSENFTEIIDELKVKLRVQTSNAEDAWKLKDSYHSSYAEAVKELYEKNKELRHHKYKRCLAMANYWGLTSACTHGETQLKCMRRELKWHKLAEKFKEAK